jgi:hypothetical protein
LFLLITRTEFLIDLAETRSGDKPFYSSRWLSSKAPRCSVEIRSQSLSITYSAASLFQGPCETVFILGSCDKMSTRGSDAGFGANDSCCWRYCLTQYADSGREPDRRSMALLSVITGVLHRGVCHLTLEERRSWSYQCPKEARNVTWVTCRPNSAPTDGRSERGQL